MRSPVPLILTSCGDVIFVTETPMSDLKYQKLA